MLDQAVPARLERGRLAAHRCPDQERPTSSIGDCLACLDPPRLVLQPPKRVL